MSDSFVPMVPVMIAASGENFVPLRLKPPEGSSPGSTMAMARDRQPPTAAANDGTSRDCASPKVTLLQDGEKVSRIRVQCSCGEVIELDCVY